MWTHTAREVIPTRDLLLAVTEPDDTGTRYYISHVHHRHIDGVLCTEWDYLPLPAIPAPHLTSDVDGSLWVDPSAVEIDAHGVAHLVLAHA
jgi:hypothetical protein